MKKVKQIGRRHFLLGACGTTLAIPFLPSLAPRAAAAESTIRRFVAFASVHSSLLPGRFFPGDEILTDAMSYGGHTIRRGALEANFDAGQALISEALFASSGVLTPALISKMNMLLGLDFPVWCNHGHGYIWGNYGASSDVEGTYDGPHTATIDQLIAHSRSVYQPVDSFGVRSLTLSENLTPFFYRGDDPSDPGSTANEVSPTRDLGSLFDQLLVGRVDTSTPEPTGPPPELVERRFVVDKVLAHFNALRQSSRIGRDDALRLERHIDRVHEIQRSIQPDMTVPVAMASACGTTARPNLVVPEYGIDEGDSALAAQYLSQMNDLIVAAFACDATRVAAIGSQSIWSDRYQMYNGLGPSSFHDGCAHVTSSQDPGEKERAVRDMMESYRNYWRAGFLDLAAKLDAITDADGNTLLDNSLLAANSQGGVVDHYQKSMPIITAGSAGGNLSTGHFCDYRNAGGDGLLINQFFATCMRAMGMSAGEFETNGNRGYGPLEGSYQGSTTQVASDMLPFIAA